MAATHPMFEPRSDARLPAGLSLGPVRLAVTDLGRSVDFYERAIGLRQLGHDDDVVALGADETMLELVEESGARPAGKHAGLYHVALLYPSRIELARAGARLIAGRHRIQGASDHGTHEAFYLADPDGNGLELAADRPREQWTPYVTDDPKSFMPQPMDAAGLLALVDDEPAMPAAGPGLRVGHLHLHVGDIARAAAFYVDTIGFDEMFNLGSALFVSAGGYHHHLGMNTWKGEGVPAAPPDVVGLRHWTVNVPDGADLSALRGRLAAAGIEHQSTERGLEVLDPWRNRLCITHAI
jgi:catechol 2,3-dioxygenase